MIVLRVDDISATTDPQAIEVLLDLLDDYGVKATFTVTPKGKAEWNDEIISVLREVARKHEIASHGLTHECNLLPEPDYKWPENRVLKYHKKHNDPYHEFLCLDYGRIDTEIQEKWLREGKRILEEKFKTRVTSFVPAQHLHDENTLEAMRNVGLDTISVERHHVAPWKENDIVFVPMSTGDVFSHCGRELYGRNEPEVVFDALKSRFHYNHSTMRYFGFYIHSWNFDEEVLRRFFEISTDIDYILLRDVKNKLDIWEGP